MKTVTIRDLRTRPKQVREALKQEREAVLTANGRPVALMIPVDAGTVDHTLETLRRARGLEALRIRFGGKLLREESVYGWLFVAPHLLGLLVFTIGAILASGYLSMTRWDLFGAPEWVGLDNYRRLLDDDIFWKTLWLMPL